jgi:hypothetical protein
MRLLYLISDTIENVLSIVVSEDEEDEKDSILSSVGLIAGLAVGCVITLMLVIGAVALYKHISKGKRSANANATSSNGRSREEMDDNNSPSSHYSLPESTEPSCFYIDLKGSIENTQHGNVSETQQAQEGLLDAGSTYQPRLETNVAYLPATQASARGSDYDEVSGLALN